MNMSTNLSKLEHSVPEIPDIEIEFDRENHNKTLPKCPQSANGLHIKY